MYNEFREFLFANGRYGEALLISYVHKNIPFFRIWDKLKLKLIQKLYLAEMNEIVEHPVLKLCTFDDIQTIVME